VAAGVRPEREVIPPLSLSFVRIAFLQLAVGTTIGALLLAAKGVPELSPAWRLLHLHQELLLIGWLLNLALGVAYWILPRFGFSRGPETPVWATLVLLNGGVLVAGGAPVVGAGPGSVLVGRLCELAAAALFVLSSWRRVRGLPRRA
jgi:hypothetical protein